MIKSKQILKRLTKIHNKRTSQRK